MRQIMMLTRFYFELFMSQFRHSCYQSTSMLYLTHIKTCFPVLFGIEVLRFHVYKKTIFDTMCPNLFVFRINQNTAKHKQNCCIMENNTYSINQSFHQKNFPLLQINGKIRRNELIFVKMIFLIIFRRYKNIYQLTEHFQTC